MKKIVYITLLIVSLVYLFVCNNNVKYKSIINSKTYYAGPYYFNSDEVNFSYSGMASKNVKAAIDEIHKAYVDGCSVGYEKGTGTDTEYVCNKKTVASDQTPVFDSQYVKYRNNTSGLDSANVKAAIIELAEKVPDCKNGFHKDNATSSSYDCLINTLPSTLTMTNNSVTLTYGTNQGNAYSYNGNGTVSCSSSDTTKVTCSVNSTTGEITLTPVNKTSTAVTITVSASATPEYYAPTDSTFTVIVNPKPITAGVSSCNNKTYNGNTTAACTIGLTGLVSGDTATASATCTFEDKNVGTSKTVTCSSFTVSNSNYTISTSSATKTANITAKPLTANTPTNCGKTYNGNTTASCTITYSNVVSGDTVTGGATCTFEDKNVGTGKTVTCSSFTKAGADNGNYTVPTGSKTTTANITALALTASTPTNCGKTYNGNTTANCTITYSNVVSGDTVTGGATCTFADKTVGTGKTVTCSSFTKAGADNGNYTVPTGSKTTTANITALALTANTPSCSNKTYNGNTTASCTITYSNVVSGDTVTGGATCTFANKTVGTGKTVTCSSFTKAGADNGNYTVPTGSKTTTANITALALTANTPSCSNKTYDRGTSASCTITYSNVVSGDTVTGGATCTFADANVGTGKTVTCSSFTKAGADNGNYTVPSGSKTTTANITAKSITASVSSCSNKTYDRGTSASCSISLTGVISGDSSTGGATCTFANATVGNSKTVTCSSFTSSNTNYTVSTTSATSSANITAKSITATVSSCSNKTYNGNTAASCTISLTGVISGDSSTGGATCTFADANVGTNKTVTCTSFTSSNTNYTVSTTSGTKTANITAQACNAPTSVSISTAGKVTWTASSNCSSAQHQISINNSSWTNASSGVDYKSTIIAATGSRTVYVRAVAPNSNYSTSGNGTASTTVYSVSLTKGTGISAVSGGGNYITGSSVTLGATVSSGYTWSKWTQTSGGAQVSTTQAYSATITGNWAYTANATANTYSVTYYPNGGSGSNTNQSVTYNTSWTTKGDIFSRTGYTLSGWSTSSTGGVTHNKNTAQGTWTRTSNLALYAVWTANSYTVTYYPNGGSGSNTNQSVTYNSSWTTKGDIFSRTGYTLSGWSTSSTGGVTHNKNTAQGAWTSTSNLGLYAKWTANTYTITYNGGGGSLPSGSSMADTSCTYNVNCQTRSNAFVKWDYEFRGWANDSTTTNIRGYPNQYFGSDPLLGGGLAGAPEQGAWYYMFFDAKGTGAITVRIYTTINMGMSYYTSWAGDGTTSTEINSSFTPASASNYSLYYIKWHITSFTGNSNYTHYFQINRSSSDNYIKNIYAYKLGNQNSVIVPNNGQVLNLVSSGTATLYATWYYVANTGNGGSGGGSTGSCFLPGTLVSTIDGYKNIEDVKVGDKVLSYNVVEDKTEYKEVSKLYVHPNDRSNLYEIDIGLAKIKATEAHRFYVVRGYQYLLVAAKDLKPGDKLVYKDGSYHAITHISYMPYYGTVYNFEVSDNHNYFVGEEGILVHNDKVVCDPINC